MKLSQLAYLSVLCAGMTLTAAEKESLPTPPETRGWRSAAAKGEEQTVAPVPGADFIRFGNKTLKLLPEGGIQCMTPEHGILFTTGMPFYSIENNRHVDWNIRHLDREKSQFRREGNKYIWELWYKGDNIKPFQGISQTLELLPDGRLLYVSSYQLPADTPELKLRTWTFGFQLKDNNWLDEKIDLDGKTQTLDLNFPRYRTKWNRKQADWTFGADNPAKKFGVHVELGKETGMTSPVIYRSAKGKHFEVRFAAVSKKHPYKVYFDFRRGLAAESMGESRGGVNFKSIENLELPDNSRRNLIQNSSFECGLKGYWCRHYGHTTGRWDWKPFEVVEDAAAPFGKYVLRFNARKNPEDDFRQLTLGTNIATQAVVAPAGNYTVSFYAKGEKDCASEITFWVPNFHSGSSHARLGPDAARTFRLSGQWKRYSFTFRLPKAQPLELHINARTRDREKAEVRLDSLQLESGVKATAYEPAPAEGRLVTSAPDNFISAQEKINGRMVITTAKPNLSGKASIRVKNFFGEELLKREIPFRSDASGTAEIALPLDELPGLGVFVLRADYQLADGTKAYEHHRYAKVDFLNNTHPNKNKFASHYGSPEKHFQFIPFLARWKKLGIGAKHHHHTYDKRVFDLERSYGVEPSHALMMSYMVNAKRKKIGFCIIDDIKTDRHLRPDDPRILVRDFYRDSDGTITPEYLKKLRNAVKTIAARHPYIPMWMLAGELLCKFHPEWWSKEKTPEACAKIHAQLLKAFVDGVKEVNPKAKVFQDSPFNMSPAGGIAETERLLRETNKLGVKFDVIAIHPYRKSPEDPDLDHDTQVLLRMLDRVGYSKVPVLWPEMMHWGPFNIPQWGTDSSTWTRTPKTWPGSLLSYDMGATERKSAAWYMRSWLVVLKYGDRILGATAGNYVNNCFMDLMLTPYAAQLVPNTLGNVLGDAVFKKDIRFAPSIRAFVFEDGQKRPVAAVWCHMERVEDGYTDNPVAEADFGNTLESVIDFMNSPRAFTAGKYRFPVNCFPLFLRGKPGTLDRMISALEGAGIVSGESIAPLDVLANPVNRKEVGIRVRNYVSRPFEGTLNGKALNIPASGQAEVVLPLPGPLDDHAVTKIPLPVEIRQSDRRKYNYDLSFEAFPAKHVPEDATFETVDWSKLPSVPFVHRNRVPQTTGSFRIGWNKLGIFIEAAIKDKTFVHTEYAKTGDRWNNDCLQIYFDTFANARVRTLKGYDEDDYAYAVFPNAAGNSSIVYRYRSVEQQLGLATQAPKDNTVAPDIPSSFSNENGVLTYRVFFPAKYLRPINLRKGWVFGFGLSAPDANRKGKLDGALTLASDNGSCHNRPHVWPAVILTD